MVNPTDGTRQGFVPPPYPYDRLAELHELAAELPGGAVDLSIGTPCDPPAAHVLAALAGSDTERGYPPSIGTPEFRGAVRDWFDRRFGVAVPTTDVAACVGTKEFVAGLPHWLALRDPDRDTVLYPGVSYPSYAMGATLAGCRAVPVAVDDRWRLDLDSIAPGDAERALCLWVNAPGNPAGGLDDLAGVAAWGRANGVPVFSDECYVDFTWDGTPVVPGGLPGETILAGGSSGVVAVHSLSKRSNLAGLRVGFYAGDPDLVGYLCEVRKHAGFMVPGPAQAAAVAALGSQNDVIVQRRRYLGRLEAMRDVLCGLGIQTALPGGGFYLWVKAPDGDAWGLGRRLARDLGVIGSPGEFYGEAATSYLRLAMVRPEREIQLVATRATSC